MYDIQIVSFFGAYAFSSQSYTNNDYENNVFLALCKTKSVLKRAVYIDIVVIDRYRYILYSEKNRIIV